MYLINVFHPLIEKRRIIVTKFLSFLLFTIWINMQDDKKFRTPSLANMNYSSEK